MNSKIKLGIIGGGGDSLIGVLHRIASFMNDNYEIVGAVFNPVWEDNINFAKKIDLDTSRIYPDFDTFIAKETALPKDKRIEVVSVLTPNFLHFPMAKKLIENGFHVICEKPLTTTYEEAEILEKSLKKSNTIFAVTYTYTGYPMVRQMREMIKNGEIGTIQKVDIQYYQGWINTIIHDKNLRNTIWRLDPKKGGISCCIGDIGTHAFNMAEYLTGLEVKSLLADLNYLYEDNTLDIDGTVLIRYSENVKGVIRASQIATGEENGLQVKIYGTKGGLKWEQENPNFLYLLSEDKPMQVYKPGHSYNSELSLNGTKLPPGHPEGIFDSMANIYLGVAKAIRNEPYDSSEFPVMNDGVRGMKFIEQCVNSHKNGNSWVQL
ncbi:Gfo/Idh/MocA family protein [Lutibacter flavus]|uniref:Predicted dehydrogenase n=1 Tax=Lutibacter flavus TaxID=691689 RepID=A0A238XBT0_9FLAO|nr:Gfo/Idh/MocA family oxidoreductase [Lutibacter flavus]SNR55339.1 Predicted dehydrogenase [Lutibacter flavus]